MDFNKIKNLAEEIRDTARNELSTDTFTGTEYPHNLQYKLLVQKVLEQSQNILAIIYLYTNHERFN